MAEWRAALAAALEANNAHKFACFCQLATVKLDGKPANRTVVYRGFVEGTNQLQFHTDMRSHKVEEIERNPWGEVCWYFVDTWQQFRFSGRLHVIGPNEPNHVLVQMRDEAWLKTSSRQRAQYLNPPPGQPRAAEENFPKDLMNENAGPLPTFALLTLDPIQVDYLHLKENQRVLYSKDDSEKWSSNNVNP